MIWHSLAMSLAAVPVFLLCRRLHVSHRLSLGAAVVAVALPSLTWASYSRPTRSPIHSPSARLRDRRDARPPDRPAPGPHAGPLRRRHLRPCSVRRPPVVFVVAAIVLERGKLPTVVRRYRLSFALLALPFVLAAATGPAQGPRLLQLGHRTLARPRRDRPLGLARHVLLMFAGGVVLAPVR